MPSKHIPYWDGRLIQPDTLDRKEFLDLKSMPEPNSGCWIWLGTVNDSGYGTLNVNAKETRAHRYSYELYRGPIPAGLVIDHLCRVRCCINPMHLEPVTLEENKRRGRLFKTHCPKGHPYGGDNLFFSKLGTRLCRTCSRAWIRRTYARYCAAKKNADALPFDQDTSPMYPTDDWEDFGDQDLPEDNARERARLIVAKIEGAKCDE